jgi:hypothetical protein
VVFVSAAAPRSPPFAVRRSESFTIRSVPSVSSAAEQFPIRVVRVFRGSIVCVPSAVRGGHDT